MCVRVHAKCTVAGGCLRKSAVSLTEPNHSTFQPLLRGEENISLGEREDNEEEETVCELTLHFRWSGATVMLVSVVLCRKTCSDTQH